MSSRTPWDKLPNKPLPNPFKVAANNMFGKDLIDKHHALHDRLIDNAHCLTDCHTTDVLETVRKFRREAQMWQIGYGEMHRRHVEDTLLSKLITNVDSRLDDTLDDHILAFKEHRLRHPNHKPGFLELTEQQKHYANHQRILRGEGVLPRVDAQPPWKALQYGRFLQSGRLTKGGVMRQPKPRRRRVPGGMAVTAAAAAAAAEELELPLLPPRRKAASVMGVAGEPAEPMYNFTSGYEVHEVQVGEAAKQELKLPPIKPVGVTQEPDDTPATDATAEPNEDYGDDFE